MRILKSYDENHLIEVIEPFLKEHYDKGITVWEIEDIYANDSDEFMMDLSCEDKDEVHFYANLFLKKSPKDSYLLLCDSFDLVMINCSDTEKIRNIVYEDVKEELRLRKYCISFYEGNHPGCFYSSSFYIAESEEAAIKNFHELHPDYLIDKVEDDTERYLIRSDQIRTIADDKESRDRVERMKRNMGEWEKKHP